MTAMIEEAEFYVDEGRLKLRLRGEFVETCESYLADEEATDLVFDIDGNQADPLVASYLKVSLDKPTTP